MMCNIYLTEGDIGSVTAAAVGNQREDFDRFAKSGCAIDQTSYDAVKRGIDKDWQGSAQNIDQYGYGLALRLSSAWSQPRAWAIGLRCSQERGPGSRRTGAPPTEPVELRA